MAWAAAPPGCCPPPGSRAARERGQRRRRRRRAGGASSVPRTGGGVGRDPHPAVPTHRVRPRAGGDGVPGRGGVGDTYETANTVPNLLFELVAAGALQAVLVPAMVEVLDGEGRAAAE